MSSLNKIFYDASKYILTHKKEFLIKILTGIERLQNNNELKNAFNNLDVQNAIFQMRKEFKDEKELLNRFITLNKKYLAVRRRKIKFLESDEDIYTYPKTLMASDLNNNSQLEKKGNIMDCYTACKEKKNFIPADLTEKKILEYEDDVIPPPKEYLGNYARLVEIVNEIKFN